MKILGDVVVKAGEEISLIRFVCFCLLGFRSAQVQIGQGVGLAAARCQHGVGGSDGVIGREHIPKILERIRAAQLAGLRLLQTVWNAGRVHCRAAHGLLVSDGLRRGVRLHGERAGNVHRLLLFAEFFAEPVDQTSLHFALRRALMYALPAGLLHGVGQLVCQKAAAGGIVLLEYAPAEENIIALGEGVGSRSLHTLGGGFVGVDVDLGKIMPERARHIAHDVGAVHKAGRNLVCFAFRAEILKQLFAHRFASCSIGIRKGGTGFAACRVSGRLSEKWVGIRFRGRAACVRADRTAGFRIPRIPRPA